MNKPTEDKDKLCKTCYELLWSDEEWFGGGLCPKEHDPMRCIAYQVDVG